MTFQHVSLILCSLAYLPQTIEHYSIGGQGFFSVPRENSPHSERKNGVLPGAVVCPVLSELDCHTLVQSILQAAQPSRRPAHILNGNTLLQTDALKPWGLEPKAT